MRVDQRAHRRQGARIRALLELARQEGHCVIVAERGEGGVERARQHARFHPVVHHVRKDVAVDGVALSEEREARVERQGAARARLAPDDLAGDALRAVLPVDDGLRDRRIRALAEPGLARGAEVSQELVELGHGHRIVLADEGADHLIDHVPVVPAGVVEQRAEPERGRQLPAPKHPLARGLRLDQP
jgi:hypothetical protein